MNKLHHKGRPRHNLAYLPTPGSSPILQAMLKGFAATGNQPAFM
ncbi:hypothetical protein [Nitrosomonas supralitoralis]|nr:hypothetical protein [Nitrosomonas supralitoralis]